MLGVVCIERHDDDSECFDVGTEIVHVNGMGYPTLADLGPVDRRDRRAVEGGLDRLCAGLGVEHGKEGRRVQYASRVRGRHRVGRSRVASWRRSEISSSTMLIAAGTSSRRARTRARMASRRSRIRRSSSARATRTSPASMPRRFRRVAGTTTLPCGPTVTSIASLCSTLKVWHIERDVPVRTSYGTSVFRSR